jgi:hypothetical protein
MLLELMPPGLARAFAEAIAVRRRQKPQIPLVRTISYIEPVDSTALLAVY